MNLAEILKSGSHLSKKIICFVESPLKMIKYVFLFLKSSFD